MTIPETQASRGEALLQLLVERAPTPAEREEMQSEAFDCDAFMIRLLCSDEAQARFGDVTQFLIDHVRTELAQNVLPHKSAHDLALAKESLNQLQLRLDGISAQMLELLRQEDRIAAAFDTLRAIQADCNALRERLHGVEAHMLQMEEPEHGV